MGLDDGLGTAITRAHVDVAGNASGPMRFGGKNHRPGQSTHGGLAVVGLFRAADPAHRLRFAIAWPQ